jgi:hypothetical protein
MISLTTSCRSWNIVDLVNEISSLRPDLQFNGYPQGFTNSAINSKGSCRPKKDEKPLGSVYIPYVKGVSESVQTYRESIQHQDDLQN